MSSGWLSYLAISHLHYLLSWLSLNCSWLSHVKSLLFIIKSLNTTSCTDHIYSNPKSFIVESWSNPYIIYISLINHDKSICFMSKTTFFTVKSPKIMVLTSLPPTPRPPYTTPPQPLDARARSLAKSVVVGGGLPGTAKFQAKWDT